VADHCAFCAGSPTTKEHIVSVQLGRRLNEAAGSRRGRFIRSRPGLPDESWESAPHTDTVKAVCAPCNNGWLARLEDRVTPLLVRILVDVEEIELRPRDQRTLPAWAFGRAVLSQYLHGSDNRVAEQDRRWLLDHMEPPPDVIVWCAFGILTRRDEMTRFFQVIGSGPNERPDALQPRYIITLRVGYLLLRVAGGLSLRDWPEATIGVERIWPPSGRFPWPSVIFNGGEDEPQATDLVAWLHTQL
jgi:hypothetical protein